MHRLRASLEQLDEVIDTLARSVNVYETTHETRAAELQRAAHLAEEKALAARLKSEQQAAAVDTISTRLDAAIAQLETLLKE